MSNSALRMLEGITIITTRKTIIVVKFVDHLPHFIYLSRSSLEIMPKYLVPETLIWSESDLSSQINQLSGVHLYSKGPQF